MNEFSREELIARLRALAEMQQPARLGTEENRAWRVICREAATALEYVSGEPSEEQIDSAADAWLQAKQDWQGHGNPPLGHLLRVAFKAMTSTQDSGGLPKVICD